jgi:hypothetical protein
MRSQPLRRRRKFAELIAHHAVYLCQRELLETYAASVRLDEALTLARRLGAKRFEAEARPSTTVTSDRSGYSAC